MSQSDTLIIETQNLGKTFGDIQALRGVDVQAPRNSIFGFLGPNGAGQSADGRGVLFEFGAVALAIGVIVLTQDAILGEKQNGLTEWLLSQPVTRAAYLLAKLVANSQAVPASMLWSPLAAALLWSVLFVGVALVRLERMEF